VALLDGGATVPFIARYRKEATGTLDDAQLRTIEERLRYLRELEERRAVVTSISPINRSVAPRPKSPRKPDWSRSLTCC
jgi:transcriptional accessory protein Tex/SPT6